MSIGDEVVQGIKETADTVTRAVETGDFSNLSNDINRTVTQTSDRVRQEAARVVGGNAAQTGRYMGGSNAGMPYGSPYVNQTQAFVSRQQEMREQRAHMSPFLTHKVSRWGSIGAVILGGIMTAGFGVGFIIFLIALLITQMIGLLGGVIPMGIFAALGGILLYIGIKSMKLSEKFYTYKRIAGDSEYLSLEDLSNKVQEPIKELRKNIKRMMNKGMLPGARLDDKESTLMLTEYAYEQYQQLQRSQQMQKEAAKIQTVDVSDLSGNEAAQRVLEEGNNYLVEVRRINDQIPEMDPMSDKLYKLEKIMQKIFEQVKLHPEKASDLRKFMSYYLPTTEKLLTSYVQLGNQPQGTNVAETKNQISGAMDTINQAFEKLLDDLFQEQAWDISSDISVMQTMFKQDGLVQEQGKI